MADLFHTDTSSSKSPFSMEATYKLIADIDLVNIAKHTFGLSSATGQNAHSTRLDLLLAKTSTVIPGVVAKTSCHSPSSDVRSRNALTLPKDFSERIIERDTCEISTANKNS